MTGLLFGPRDTHVAKQGFLCSKVMNLSSTLTHREISQLAKMAVAIGWYVAMHIAKKTMHALDFLASVLLEQILIL